MLVPVREVPFANETILICYLGKEMHRLRILCSPNNGLCGDGGLGLKNGQVWREEGGKDGLRCKVERLGFRVSG